MLHETRYTLQILQNPNEETLTGDPNFNPYQYWYQLTWDDRIWATGTAHSPKLLGESLGKAIETMAHAAEGSRGGRHARLMARNGQATPDHREVD